MKNVKKLKCPINIFTTENMEIISLLVPQQQNLYDCGIYVMQYIENFYMV